MISFFYFSDDKGFTISDVVYGALKLRLMGTKIENDNLKCMTKKKTSEDGSTLRTPETTLGTV